MTTTNTTVSSTLLSRDIQPHSHLLQLRPDLGQRAVGAAALVTGAVDPERRVRVQPHLAAGDVRLAVLVGELHVAFADWVRAEKEGVRARRVDEAFEETHVFGGGG